MHVLQNFCSLSLEYCTRLLLLLLFVTNHRIERLRNNGFNTRVSVSNNVPCFVRTNRLHTKSSKHHLSRHPKVPELRSGGRILMPYTWQRNRPQNRWIRPTIPEIAPMVTVVNCTRNTISRHGFRIDRKIVGFGSGFRRPSPVGRTAIGGHAIGLQTLAM